MTHYFAKQTWQRGSSQQYTGKTKGIFLHWLPSMAMLLVMTFLINQKLICEYNKYTGGIDHNDQLLVYFAIGWKPLKWWKHVFWRLLNIVLVNSHLLYELKPDKNQLPRSSSSSIYAILWFSHYLRREKIWVQELSGSLVPGSSSLWLFKRKAFWAKGWQEEEM